MGAIASVAGRCGATLGATEARRLLDSIDVRTPVGLRARALMVFPFARVGARDLTMPAITADIAMMVSLPRTRVTGDG
jgi:hypothetical protein